MSVVILLLPRLSFSYNIFTNSEIVCSSIKTFSHFLTLRKTRNCLIKSFRPNYRLFIGNPGTGKSTLANCIARSLLFKSGLKFGDGMTFQLDMKKCNEVTYLDTPGLDDIKLRKQAAAAITKALKQNGTYQIFFVITLEAGRLRTQDVLTIKLVLESSSDLKYFSLIVNKLSERAYKHLTDNKGKELKCLLAELNEQIDSVKLPQAVLLLQTRDDLLDADDKVVTWSDLEKFATEAACTTVKPDSVLEIPVESGFTNRILELMEQQIKDLRNDKKRLFQLVENMEKLFLDQTKENCSNQGVSYFT